ncbi:hypothetical protein SAMN05519103_01944 [Rhizobiales bacterium GAS113]|nr:hypothetical protein SAMN05519103_01944 [Rhizobiales bacterium GAS113]
MANLRLTSEQQSAIHQAAFPLAPADQQTFTRRVLAQLEAEPVLGDGLVWRVSAAAQAELWTPLPDGQGRRPGADPLRKIG